MNQQNILFISINLIRLNVKKKKQKFFMLFACSISSVPYFSSFYFFLSIFFFWCVREQWILIIILSKISCNRLKEKKSLFAWKINKRNISLFANTNSTIFSLFVSSIHSVMPSLWSNFLFIVPLHCLLFMVLSKLILYQWNESWRLQRMCDSKWIKIDSFSQCTRTKCLWTSEWCEENSYPIWQTANENYRKMK